MEQVIYQFRFSTEEVRALWQCIQLAPVPRGATDGLAAAFQAQLDEQNKALVAKPNGAAQPVVNDVVN
jgi:hypothetical protein